MILNSNLTSQNGMSLPNTLQRLLSVEHGEKQTQTRLTKNLVGKSFIIGDGTDVYVTFINCKATKDHCNYMHSLGNPSKDRQRFVDAVVLIVAPDWSNRLSSFENVIETQFESVFERRMPPGFSKL